MGAYEIVMIIFLIIACACIFGCVISTMLVFLHYQKMKKEWENEIEHIKKERNVCLDLLKRRNTQDGS